MWLDAIAPAGVRLLLFAGKGGVGKTTCAAAVALALAARARDRRVLLLSTDPAHSLGDVLDAALDDVPRSVPGGPARLEARELDAQALFAGRRRRYLAGVASAADELRKGSRFDFAFDRTVVEDLIDLAPPGIDELLGLLAVVEPLTQHAADADPSTATVVVDTAPTGHLLRLLAMPQLGLEWVHALMELLLKYRKVIGLGQLGSDLVEMSRQLKNLQAVLTDRSRARLVVITRATEIPRLETRRLIAGVRALGVGISSVVVNALTPPGCARCRLARTREERVVTALRRDLAELAVSGCAIIGTPAIAPPPRGPMALRRWQQTWMRIDA
jgi:arsenite-transporting ATPase